MRVNPGDRLGRYVLDRLLGRGAVGEVFQATDPLIGRKVALKTLRTDLDVNLAAEFRQRFLREAVAAGRLNHPNITTLYDVGEDPATGVAFIAMEFVAGSTLESVAGAGTGTRLDLARAVELGATLAEALAYAHREGVVHRDVKPANILVTADGAPKITDFGIARLDSSTLTVQGAVLGTPYYMSPEQVAGQTADGRTDLYALGIILFELLTGTRPYSGRSLMTMLRAIISEQPADLTSLRADIPPALSAVVRTALAKDPAARYQTGAELAAALRAVDLAPPALPPVAPEVADLDGATAVGISLAGLGELSGTLEFAAGNRRVHLRSKAEIVIGRDPSADIHLADQKISRRHATVRLTERGARFTDLGSANGSTVNGVVVTAPVELADGDVLGVGATVHFLVRVRRATRPPVSLALVAGGDEYLLNCGEIAIGSDAAAVDVRLGDARAAGVHARLAGTLAGPQVIAVDPARPVLVDHLATTSARLGDRASLEVGATRMTWIEARGQLAVPGPTRF